VKQDVLQHKFYSSDTLKHHIDHNRLSMINNDSYMCQYQSPAKRDVVTPELGVVYDISVYDKDEVKILLDDKNIDSKVFLDKYICFYNKDDDLVEQYKFGQSEIMRDKGE